MVSEETQDAIRSMTVQYGATVQRVVSALIGYGLRNMTAKEIRKTLAAIQKQSGTGQYQRTKPF